MNTLKYMRLREEGSLNERTFKRVTVQKCDWDYEDFLTAEMVQDSTMFMLQGRFLKGDDKSYLRKTVDTLMTVGRIVRRTREIHKRYYAKLSEESEETNRSIIAEMVNKVVKKYLQSLSLSDTLKFLQFLDDPNRENSFFSQSLCSTNSGLLRYCCPKIDTVVF
ncbi:hypothetical protein CEXT_95161 [Caerostris extrusa]|uniref:Uncharacterized protein n=1 Tax=Caerostris extrusa TaxID=172846 RepID=A0AAV4PEH7_CAEEX|nr:hypothetical protein CEXT_95161 [Caerostris extrusa]